MVKTLAEYELKRLEENQNKIMIKISVYSDLFQNRKNISKEYLRKQYNLDEFEINEVFDDFVPLLKE